MTRLLLDTNALIWVLVDSPKLGPLSRKAIADAEMVYASAAAIWEITMKRVLGKLEFSVDICAECKDSGFIALPITHEHAAATASIQLPHKDPFGKVLCAQAEVEECSLLTADQVLLEALPDLCLDARA